MLLGEGCVYAERLSNNKTKNYDILIFIYMSFGVNLYIPIAVFDC